MKNQKFTHSCDLFLDNDVFRHYFTLRITPHDDPSQTITIDECRVEPIAECTTQTDGYGNLLYIGSYEAAHDSFTYTVSGTAVVDSTHGRGADLNESYRYPSTLTTPGAAIKALHEKAGCFDAEDHGSVDAFNRALELRSLVHDSMAYDANATTVETTAEAACAMGRGVCQDYAHILCALLRMDGIPARYVSGLMWGEGATHAWVEFHDGTTWWGMDPTNDCEAGDYYICLARGRDHADCPIENGVFRGVANQEQHVKVSVEVIE